MRLTYRKSGGVAGLLQGAELDSTTLPPQEAQQLKGLLAAYAKTGPVHLTTPGARDLFLHDLTIDTPAGPVRFLFDDGRIPPEAKALIRHLEGMARLRAR
jgi:hypothetical protein